MKQTEGICDTAIAKAKSHQQNNGDPSSLAFLILKKTNFSRKVRWNSASNIRELGKMLRLIGSLQLKRSQTIRA